MYVDRWTSETSDARVNAMPVAVAPHNGRHRKKPVVDPGRVQVEIIYDRYAVGARWQFGANKLRDDLLRIRVPGW